MGLYGEIGAGLNFYNLIKDLIPLKTSVFYKTVFFKGIKSLIRLLKFSLARLSCPRRSHISLLKYTCRSYLFS